MTAWVKPSPDFVDNTPITAAPHNANWDSIEAYVNGLATGTNLDAGIITAGKIGTAAVTEGKIAGQAVTKDKLAQAVLNMFTPIGTIVAYAGVVEPTGWKWCDGTVIADMATSYPDLYAVLGNSTTLPNLQDRFPIGASATKTIRTTNSNGQFITTGQLPAHTHANAPVLTSGTLTITSTDSGHGHPGSTTVGPNDGLHNHPQTVEATTSTSHTHGSSGTAGNPSGTGSTGTDYTGTSVHGHNLTIATGNASITSTGTVGTAITANNAAVGNGEAYWQPYYAVNYIIRAI
jgi:hypothetical protein